MHTLIIRHVEGLDPARFVIQRAADSKAGEPVEVRSPVDWPVEGQPGGLVSELRWYLEDFLEYPFDPRTERAARIEAAVRAWGRAAFEALFGSGRARDFYRDAVRDGPEKLHVQVRSDDPRVLAWPWEALEDGEAAPLALTGRVERSLDKVADPAPLPAELPRDRVNILLVIARPYDGDVGYRSIARELVELVEKHRLPAHVTVLRPPTFARLQEVLAEHPNTFHMLHFDGHGGYGDTAGPAGVDGHRLQAVQGRLVFETDDGSPDPIDAGRLADLLRVHRLPTVVLSACQSAMLDERAEDPFASVAAALLKGGVRSVVAMAWSLYVSGAQQFLPAYYEMLFKAGDVGQAARAGRRKMREQPGRVCARGQFPLSDWLVPVVYQQAALDFSFATVAPPPEKRAALPAEARDEENPYDFVGRDSALLALERAMRRKPAGLLIHGLGGVGKTTLARGFVHWLAQTGGLGRAFWFTFNDIHSAEHVINQMTQALFGTNALTEPMEAKVDALVRTLREHPHVVVWDNFESARGIEGTPERGLLPPDDQAWLKQLLAKLRGGRTKVLITSRSEEAWLGVENRFKLDLGGLHGEERWAFCQAILNDLGRRADRNDPNLVALMNALDGHPLMMRMVLPRLEGMSAAEILAAVRSNLAALGLTGDVLHEKVTATLRFVGQGLPEELRPLCVPLGLHERFVVAEDLVAMGVSVGSGCETAHVERFLQMLAAAGLVVSRGHGIYALHPALTGFLRTMPVEGDVSLWERAFVDRMGSTADAVTPRPPHEQRRVFIVHHTNFHHALGLAGTHHMDAHVLALTQSMAAYAQNTRNFIEAERLFTTLVDRAHGLRPDVTAGAYHQLGRVAEERRDLGAAEKWYLKSLAINEKHGNEHHVANTYHQLGRVAEERRDFDAAEEWYLKSLAINEKNGNEHAASGTYHQLGIVAEERRDFKAAETWYRKSLVVWERPGNEHYAAITYHQLGMVAQERQDFEGAEMWYRKSLAIKERQGDEYGASSAYHQLGRVAEQRRDFDTAEKWYLKSLAISEKQGNEYCAASTYHHLGIVSEQRRDFDTAELWYLKSLTIKEKQTNEHGAASTYHQLGRVMQERRHFDAAEEWYLKAAAILERPGNEYYAATTYGQLGILKALRGDHESSARWLIRCAQAFLSTRGAAGAEQTARNFLLIESAAPTELRPRLRAMWADADLPPLPESAES